jgi:D-lactate dehydrogenase
MTPELVVDVASVEQVQRVNVLAAKYQLGITYRAAGTSLSGQASTDQVLVRLVPSAWRQFEIDEHVKSSNCDPDRRDDVPVSVKLGVGWIGGQANDALRPLGRKIGPDPSSIDACMIGGIANNNSSGMCCGVSGNTYKTLESLRVVLADGTELDTGCDASRRRFASSHGDMLRGLEALARRTRADRQLRERIERKYAIKNTTGYSLNALVDFADGLDILEHLVVGSEGTLAFVADVKLRTLVEHRHKACALVMFDSVRAAVEATQALSAERATRDAISAVELMDRPCLVAAAEHMRDALPANVHAKLDAPGCAALLIETRAPTKQALDANVRLATERLAAGNVHFTSDPARAANLWAVRKGIIAIAGAERPPGTSVLLEDVAVSVEHLAALTADLQRIFAEHGYDDALIFGHARDGNLHLLFSQSFASDGEVARYDAMMTAMCRCVAQKYDGSLKAEHGTGRNVAPFVELEWGRDAYELMREIKQLFDPSGLLNPGVLLNDDPRVHLEHLKQMPLCDALVDKCIECGFCERMCPSREFTLSPRQRIALARQQPLGGGDDDDDNAAAVQHYAIDTCAADGMCSTACPVGINTGAFVKRHRAAQVLSASGPASAVEARAASAIASHFGVAMSLLRLGLSVYGAMPAPLQRLATRIAGFGSLPPDWMPSLGVASKTMRRIDAASGIDDDDRPTVVYFPACVNRLLGSDSGKHTVDATMDVLERAGLRVRVPANVDSLCCGLPFNSKGYRDEASALRARLHEALWRASERGRYPVFCDTSQCSLEHDDLLDPIEFARDHVVHRLDFASPLDSGIVVAHVPCSAKRAKLAQDMHAILARCTTAECRIDDSDVPCCGMAGDRGLTYPGLSESALRPLDRVIKPHQANIDTLEGCSTSRTCQIGLGARTDRPFLSLFSFIDRANSRQG